MRVLELPLLLITSLLVGGHAQQTTTHDAATLSSPAICRYRTVNYITAQLAQQCLPASRSVLARSGQAQDSATGGEATTSTTTQAGEDSAVTATPSEGPVPTVVPSPMVLSPPDTPLLSEIDADSPLDNAKFLSFEEWKQQNLAKSGQDAATGHAKYSDHISRSRPINNNGLDTLGEDSEIELDFSGFGGVQDSASSVRPAAAPTESALAHLGPSSQSDVPSVATLRSKDAGRTCKERTNYASFDCAATVLKSNRECKSASSVLIENKDSYMLNVCSAPDKHIIVELCNDILIDTVVLANYEFFSSIFHKFRVSVSDRYPPKGDRWKDLGVFEARNTRQVQAFLVEQPLIWARFVKINFLTHYGNEYYCPVSLFRVHGTTMLEEFKHQEEGTRGDDAEADGTAVGDMRQDKQNLEAVPAFQEPLQSSVAADKSVAYPIATTSAESTHVQDNQSTTPVHAVSSSTIVTGVCLPTTAAEETVFQPTLDLCEAESSTKPTDIAEGYANRVQTENSGQTTTSHRDATPSARPSENNAETTELVHANSTANPSSTPGSRAVKVDDIRSSDQHKPSSQSHASSVNASSAATKSDTVRQPNTVVPPPPIATTQESFYKSIHKRLQQLELNATLSLQYIEEQSRILRDAFTKVERRQVEKTEKFLSELNRTVMGELAVFRTQYDHLWQSTVIELETHREQYQREILAISSRLNLVAEELLFQKRMVMLQSTLLMLCLGLVVFAKIGGGGGAGLTLEVPLIQQMLAKSSSYAASHRYSAFYGNGPDSPPSHSPPLHDAPSPSSWRHSWSNSWILGGQSPTSEMTGESSKDDGRDSGMVGLEMNFQPPTPSSDERWESTTSVERRDGAELLGVEERLDPVRDAVRDPRLDGLRTLETQSSPSTPTGSREAMRAGVDHNFG